MNVNLPHNFTPRAYQLPGLIAHDVQGKKRIYDVWHRRSGKDVTWWNQMYFYVLPTYRQARKIIWDGISDTGFRYLNYCPRALRNGKPNETEMKIRMRNGSIVQLMGSDNYDSMMGTNPVGIVYSEYALQDPMAWELMRPILAENGGWAVFLTTPRGHNHAWELAQIAQKSRLKQLAIHQGMLAPEAPVGTTPPPVGPGTAQPGVAAGQPASGPAAQEHNIDNLLATPAVAQQPTIT